jgi:hypothetical protein
MVDSDYAEYENVDDSQNSSLYEWVWSFEALNERCQEFMQKYNWKSASCCKKLDIVLFDDVMTILFDFPEFLPSQDGISCLLE